MIERSGVLDVVHLVCTVLTPIDDHIEVLDHRPFGSGDRDLVLIDRNGNAHLILSCPRAEAETRANRVRDELRTMPPDAFAARYDLPPEACR